MKKKPKPIKGDPTPLDILKRRIELHLDRNSHLRPVEGDPNYDQFVADKLADEMAELQQSPAKWKLEEFEGHQRLREVLNGDPLDLSIAQLGISEMVANALERYGIIWVRQLLEWTTGMLLSVPMIGPKGAAEIRLVIEPLGLRLRNPMEGEQPELPPCLPRPYSKKRYQPYAPNKVDERKRARTIVLALADGVIPTLIVERLGLSTKATRLVSDLRNSLEKRRAKGECPREIARSLGFKFGNSAYSRAVSYLESLSPKS